MAAAAKEVSGSRACSLHVIRFIYKLLAAIAEISKIQNWRARVESEVNAQLKFANDWGTLMEKPPATSVEEEIALKKAELAALRASFGGEGAASTSSSVHGAGADLEVFRKRKP